MLAKIWYQEELVEVTEELINALQKRVDQASGQYRSFVLAVKWNTKLNCMEFDMDGPWEC